MEDVFLRVLNMGITAGYCVLVLLFVRLFLKKLPKIYSYVLWSVVYFRLVCPVSIKSVFSLLKISPQTVPPDIGMQINPRITSGVPQVDTVVNTGLAQAAPAVEASVNPMQIVVYGATVVWGIGVLLLFGYSVWSVMRLKGQLKDARFLGENLYESEKLHTPFVLGFFAPRIYLPAKLGEKERVYVLAHERTHIKRRDYLIKEAAFFVTCIYWFHPLVWLAFYMMCRDMEMSCDESVIRSMGKESKKEYSAALLSLACGRQIVNGSPLAFGEGGIKGRITNVLRYKRPAFWGGVVIAVVLAAVLLGLALNPKEQYMQDESYKNEEQPVALRDFLMGQAEMPLGNKTVTVELWMTKGEYFDIEHAVPGGGIYEENYQGSYELRTVDSWGKVLDTRKLGADLSFWGEETSCNFPGKLDLAWTDYNVDGCPDFTIGMAGSSSTNFYQLYTVREDGTLAMLCDSEIPGQAGAELSVVFEHDTSSEGLPLLGYFWNNELGVGEHWFYYYNQETGLYEEGDKVIPKVEDDGETAFSEDNGKSDEDARLLTEEEAARQTIAEAAATEQANGKTAVSQSAGSDGAAAHREGFIEPVLHLHVSDYLADSEYIDTSLLPEEEHRALAVLAWQELYDLTGTQVEECYYYYNVQGNFLFAMSEADMDHDRTFYCRGFDEEKFAGAFVIPQMHFSNARRTWFSPVYQYDLPENFADMQDVEKAVWFLEHSAVFQGGTVADYWQPYRDDIPQLWRIAMEDGTAYEVLLDNKIDAVTDIIGPYPTSDFEH